MRGNLVFRRSGALVNIDSFVTNVLEDKACQTMSLKHESDTLVLCKPSDDYTEGVCMACKLPLIFYNICEVISPPGILVSFQASFGNLKCAG